MNIRIAILMTCHNRAQTTLQCLDTVFRQEVEEGVHLDVFLVDDGSTDGTADAVRDGYPQVQIIAGNGDLYWNRGMHRAFEAALRTGFDYYLWLNDDTFLHTNALDVLLKTHHNLASGGAPASIIVASARDPATGEFSYGGYSHSGRLNLLKFKFVQPTSMPVSCETFCGNCILIPGQVAERVGNIDPSFEHRWGDVDYGLRARACGCQIWVAPGFLADCEANPKADRWRDRSLLLRERLKELHSLKGVGKHDWRRFVQKHGGRLWLLIWVRPYLRIVVDTIR